MLQDHSAGQRQDWDLNSGLPDAGSALHPGRGAQRPSCPLPRGTGLPALPQGVSFPCPPGQAAL